MRRNQQNYLTAFETYLLTERRISKNTFFAYKNDIDQLVDFLKLKKVSLERVTKVHLKNFLKFLKNQNLKAKTLSRKISSIKLFFKFLNKRFDIQNRAESLIFPKLEQRLPVYLTEEEIQKLLTAANKDGTAKGIRNKVMIYLLYATGMRVSELVNLTIDQIHFDTGFLRVLGKGNKERLVPLPENVLELLKFYLKNVYYKFLPKGRFFKFEEDEKQKNFILNSNIQEDNYLFITIYRSKAKHLTRQAFWMLLKKILILSGIKKKVSPHSLRHSLATHLLKNGANIRSLQMLLGHEQLATVQIYTHLENSQLRKIYDAKHPRSK